MKKMYVYGVSAKKSAYIWIIFVIVSLVLFFTVTSFSYAKVDALSIWVLSCISVLYLSEKKGIIIENEGKKAVIIAGFFVILLSFFNIGIGLGNPPYSIAEYTIFLTGIGIVYFGFMGYKKFIVPVLFPLAAVLGFEFYDLFLKNEEWLIKPLIPPVVYLTTGILNILGLNVQVSGNVINYMSLTNEPIYLAVVTDCTGIWSLGTFTIAVMIVIFTFEKSLSPNSYLLIFVGYIGTYLSNIGRIVIIALSGYFNGTSGVMEQFHIHTGWVLFTLWMIVFWYYFLICHLGLDFGFKKKMLD